MYHTHLRIDDSHENCETEVNFHKWCSSQNFVPKEPASERFPSGEEEQVQDPASVETDWSGMLPFHALAVPELTRRGRRVRVRLAEAIPLVRIAMEEQLAWVEDFDDETIDISPDLFELLAVYRRFVSKS